MIHVRRLFILPAFLLVISAAALAQTGPSARPTEAKKTSSDKEAKAAKDANAERIMKERRAQAQTLLISLAADAGNYSDSTLRARSARAHSFARPGTRLKLQIRKVSGGCRRKYSNKKRATEGASPSPGRPTSAGMSCAWRRATTGPSVKSCWAN